MRVDKSKWKIRRLSEIAYITMGQSPESSSYNKEAFGLPFYQGNADFGKKHPTPRIYCNAPTRTAKEHELLISVRAPIGAINITVEPCCIGRGLAAIKMIDGISYLHFMKYVLKAANYELNRQGTGMTFKAINKKVLHNLVIHLPTFDVQQAIASELDAVQEMIDGYKAQLADLDVLAQSIFLDTFGDPISNPKGWKKKSLGTLCEVSSAKRVLVKDIVSEGVPFIRGTELAILSKQCFFDKSIFSMFITPEHYDKVKAITGVPEIDDLLIPSINPYGYVWRINTTEPIYFKDGRVIWIHTNHSIYNGDCLRHILVYEILEKYSKLSGAVFAELTLVFLRTLKIIVPPLPLQQQFAKQVEAIEKQKNLLREQLKDAETLMAERMQYYFS